MADLVAVGQNRLAGRRMRVDRPTGDEERGFDFVTAQSFQNFRDADAGLVAAIGAGDQAAGILRIGPEPGVRTRAVRNRTLSPNEA